MVLRRMSGRFSVSIGRRQDYLRWGDTAGEFEILQNRSGFMREWMFVLSH